MVDEAEGFKVWDIGMKVLSQTQYTIHACVMVGLASATALPKLRLSSFRIV